jgi:predicted phosphoribosyltransferase
MGIMLRFTDHAEAGKLLAAPLRRFVLGRNAVVLALRRPAIDVAVAVADALAVPAVLQQPPIRPIPLLRRATVILVHHGFASERELRDMVAAARVHSPAALVVAAPVAAADAVTAARDCVDGFVCLASPVPFRSVSFWYEDATTVGQRRGWIRDTHRQPFSEGPTP